MRGFFAIGIDGASKEGNVGNLIRTAHAFGANFVFAVKPKRVAHTGEVVTKDFADTSKTHEQIPFFNYDSADAVPVPQGGRIVGIELDDAAIDLPSFRHPAQALYVLGGERSSLSPEMRARCDFMIKIPTHFSLNVATAGAIVLYDRWRLMGGFAERPVMAGQTPVEPRGHVHGRPISRRDRAARRVKAAGQ